MAAQRATLRQKGPIRATLLMSSFGYKDADPDDMDFMTMVAQIEQRNAVVIDLGSDNKWLEIYAFTKDNAAKALDAIRSALKLEVGGAKVWHPTVLMAPVKVGTAGFKARLEPTPDGARPCASSEAVPTRSSAEFGGLHAKWQNEFRKKLFQAAKQIRCAPNKMRMRVTLGILLLQEWKRTANEYTYGELENIFKRLGVRGTFSFSQMLGTAQLAHNLLTKIYASPDYFEPVSTRIGMLQHVKPTHTLILTTASLKVETEVILVQESDSSREVLRLGTAKGYRRERRSRAVEIATSCPERKYDWNLAVHTRVPVASLPFSHDDITKHSSFARRADPYEFPDIRIRPEFNSAFRIEQITGKTSWVFKIKGSVYAIEVAIYNILATADRKEGEATHPLGGCGVDVFRPGWDEMLCARDVASGARQLSENCKELFPLMEKRLTDKDGVETLVRRVAEIHDLVSGLDDKVPARVAEEVVPQAEEEEEDEDEEDLLLSWE